MNNSDHSDESVAVATLLHGPTACGDIDVSAGNRIDFLRSAYHPRLKVYALPRKSSVALFQCVEHLFDPMSCHVDNLDPSSELLLHNVDGKEISKQKKALFRLIEWSNGDNQNLLAIASTDRLEIWSVQNNDCINATLLASYVLPNIRGLAWNPIIDFLMIITDKRVLVLDGSLLQAKPQLIHETNGNNSWKHGSWNPEGTSFSISSDRQVDILSWDSPLQVMLKPVHLHLKLPLQIIVQSKLGSSSEESMKLGPISSICMVSPSLCVIATDTPLVFDDSLLQANKPKTELLSVISSSTASLMSISSHTESTSSVRSTRNGPMDLIKIVEDSRTTVNKQDEVIDLTSLRILKSTSQNNSLRILDRAAENRQRRVSSHLVVLAKGATEWKLDECITIPSSISCPDILLIKKKSNVVIGSNMSDKILVANLERQASKWKLRVREEVCLPTFYTCRGVYLSDKGTILQVASSQRKKSGEFFNASPTSQNLSLLTFKLATGMDLVKTKSSGSEKVEFNPPLDVDTGSMLLAAMKEMQQQLETRLSRIENVLQDMNSRLCLMETKVASS